MEVNFEREIVIGGDCVDKVIDIAHELLGCEREGPFMILVGGLLLTRAFVGVKSNNREEILSSFDSLIKGIRADIELNIELKNKGMNTIQFFTKEIKD